MSRWTVDMPCVVSLTVSTEAETKEEAIENLVDDTGVLAEVDWFTIEALIGSKAWKSHVPKSITLVGGDSHAE